MRFDACGTGPRTLVWTLLLTGCAGHQPAAPLSPPPPGFTSVSTRSLPVEPSALDMAPPPMPAAGEEVLEPAVLEMAVAAPPPEPAAVARVELEPPYKTFQRPRSAGPVLAAGEDEALSRWNVGGTGDPNFISNRASFHPGARVVVDTELLAGQLPAKSGAGLTQRALLAQSRSRGYWPLRLCYEDALRRNPKLSGETRVRFTIGRSGKVTRAHLERTALDEEAGRCLSLAVENLSYEPGPSAGLVAVELSVKFWRGDAPLPTIGPAPGQLFENPGRLEPNVVAEVLAPAVPAVENCYARGLIRDPGLWGRLGLRIDLAVDGTVASVHEDESRFPDREVSECVVSQLAQLNFPPPAGGPLSFVQAFLFGTPPAPDAPDLAASP